MILVDTGPLVALFDPQDDAHERAKKMLAGVREPLVTTVCVLTEVFHLLDPSSAGARAQRTFILQGALRVWSMDDSAIVRSFELMDRYRDRPMDLADASLVAAAESLRTTTIFTLNRRDFTTYRARIGRSYRGFRLLD